MWEVKIIIPSWREIHKIISDLGVGRAFWNKLYIYKNSTHKIKYCENPKIKNFSSALLGQPLLGNVSSCCLQCQHPRLELWFMFCLFQSWPRSLRVYLGNQKNGPMMWAPATHTRDPDGARGVLGFGFILAQSQPQQPFEQWASRWKIPFSISAFPTVVPFLK